MRKNCKSNKLSQIVKSSHSQQDKYTIWLGERTAQIVYCVKKYTLINLELMEKSSTIVHNYVHNILSKMENLIVTTANFRKDIKSYFDAAEAGKKVLIRRGNQLFTLVPLSDDDVDFSPKMIDKIKKSIDQIHKGKSIQVSTPEELNKLLKKL
jgi:antitoxin YefM